jgi:O-antigen ligase
MVAAILVASNMSTEITTNNELHNSGRARLVTLNPISLGHLGASLLLVSLAVLIAGRDHEITLRALAFVGLIFGIVLLIASNSRGPIVAAAVAILFGWFAQRGRRRLNLTVIAVGLYLAFNPALLLVETHFGATTYSRLYGQSLGEEVNVVARLTLYQSAFEAFSQNLLFGAGLEMTESSSYPHNVTLEAFLATGLFGGLVFLALELAAILAAWRICRIDKRFLWAGMIVVQYVIASQFSGTIYAAAQFWPAIGLVTFASGILVHRPSQLPSVSRKASGHG